MADLEERLNRYTDLLYRAVREINELTYNSLIDPQWKKAIGDYHKLETTLVSLGIVLEDIVTMLKIMNKGRKS